MYESVRVKQESMILTDQILRNALGHGTKYKQERVDDLISDVAGEWLKHSTVVL